MKVGILKTGRPPRPAIPKFGTYPDMFMRLLGPDEYAAYLQRQNQLFSDAVKSLK